MLSLKIKSFQKWARKAKIEDPVLIKAIGNLKEEKGTVDLGSGLFKVRVARPGQGKSGGFRTFLAYKKDDKAIFIYGFAKNEKDNLETDELEYFKRYAAELIDLSNETIEHGLQNGTFFRIEGDEK